MRPRPGLVTGYTQNGIYDFQPPLIPRGHVSVGYLVVTPHHYHGQKNVFTPLRTRSRLGKTSVKCIQPVLRHTYVTSL